MKRFLQLDLLLFAAMLLWFGGLPLAFLAPSGGRAFRNQAAPEFPTRNPKLWINSAPLSISDLRGRVVLIDVWTYG